MKKLKVGLNGFGRIGRAFTRIVCDGQQAELVAINTRKTTIDMMAYTLKYDSVYRTYEKDVAIEGTVLNVGGQKIATLQNDRPESIPWEQYGVDVVVDATGAFSTQEDLLKHIKGSVKKVVLTQPSKDDVTPHLVLGVNDDTFDFAGSPVISNCSCTTNCASPLFKVLNDAFGVDKGSLTTVHAVTLTQSLLDDTGKTFDRSRAAFQNIVPSTSGASRAVVKTIPDLKGKIDVSSIRVPVPTVSLCDATVVVGKNTTVEEVNKAFKNAAEGRMKGIMHYATETLVSSDYIGSSYSCIFDSNYSKVTGGTMVKVVAWYDNEWGYTCRLVDLVQRLGDVI